MTPLDVHTLLDRITQIAGELDGPSALLFDADGTLWEGDVGIDTFTLALERNLLREAVRDALLAEIAKHRLEIFEPAATGDANVLGRELERAFEAGTYPERAATEMQVWAYAGWTEGELREHTRQALETRQHLLKIRESLLPLMIWARDAGVRTIVVSASPEIVVQEATRSLGFAPSDIVAGRARRGPDGYLPTLAEPLPYGADKVRAGRRLLGDAHWLAAFGDSAFDAEMLRESKLPVLVRPRPGLLERLPDLPGAILLKDS